MAEPLKLTIESVKTWIDAATGGSFNYEVEPPSDDNPPPTTNSLPRYLFWVQGDARPIAKTCTLTVYQAIFIFRIWHRSVEDAGTSMDTAHDAIINEAAQPAGPTGVDIIETRDYGTAYRAVDSSSSYAEKKMMIKFSQNRVK